MTDPNHPHFIYPTDAWSYVERAQKQLQLFDAGNPESLFYAAFELRMGIESRITYGLKSLLRARGMPEQKLEKYDLDKIFKKLETIDENTLKPSTLVISTPGGQTAGVWQYTPITKDLTRDYGTVSDLLHYQFFLRKKDWFAKQRLWPQYNTKSLLDYRDILGDIAKRLEEASSGDLLAPPPPSLFQLLDEVDEDTEE